jgi:hypothetical protein
MAFGNMMGQKLLIMQFKIIQKTLLYSVFTKTTMATFGLEHTKMVHINLTETHLKNLNHNDRKNNSR